MKILYDKNGCLLGDMKSDWTNTFAIDICGVWLNSVETLPLYQGNLKECVEYMVKHNIISKEEATNLMENDMLVDEEIEVEEKEIQEPTVSELVEEIIPADDELFSISCNTCKKTFNMMNAKSCGGNPVCSHCGGVN